MFPVSPRHDIHLARLPIEIDMVDARIAMQGLGMLLESLKHLPTTLPPDNVLCRLPHDKVGFSRFRAEKVLPIGYPVV
jgi:hypothetical protein